MQYLKGLNSLRFFAALLVLAGHARLELAGLGVNHAGWPVLDRMQDAVHFFFVLSGFLLTYLAIGEFDKKGAISIRQFFIKRILRTWPLYYLCVAIGFVTLGVVVPYLYGAAFFSFPVGQALPYFLLFVPNYFMAIHFTANTGALFTLWTLGVEEQFYLFFPFLMLLVLKSRRPVLYMICVAAAYTFFYQAINAGLLFNLPGAGRVFMGSLQFHFMLYGCLGAVLYKKRKVWIDRVLPDKKITQLVLLSIAGVLLFTDAFSPNNTSVSLLYTVLTGLLFTAIIINTFSSKYQLINFEQPWLTYLGKISFGIYMFHPYVSYPLRYAILKLAWVKALFTAAPALYYVLLLGVTICVAHLSYKYFEMAFLKMKKNTGA